PAVLLVSATAALLWRTRRNRGAVAVIAATVVGASIHGLYVARVGGDFMHGRLLLPATFALAMPCSVVRFRRASALRTAVALAILWSVVCAFSLRPPREDRYIVDERAFWVNLSGASHPVTANDYRPTVPYGEGLVARHLEETHAHVLS